MHTVTCPSVHTERSAAGDRLQVIRQRALEQLHIQDAASQSGSAVRVTQLRQRLELTDVISASKAPTYPESYRTSKPYRVAFLEGNLNHAETFSPLARLWPHSSS